MRSTRRVKGVRNSTQQEIAYSAEAAAALGIGRRDPIVTKRAGAASAGAKKSRAPDTTFAGVLAFE